MTQDRILAALIAVATLAFVASPLLVPGFGGFDPDRFPIPQVEAPAQPAGYAFAIWGLIYAWLLASAGYGLLRRAEHGDWTAMRPALLVSVAVGAIWLPVAKASPLWAMVLIWVMLIAALLAMLRSGGADRWLLRAPLSVYAGWLSAASWVSIAINGAGYGVLFGSVAWAWIAVVGLVAMAVPVQLRMGWGPGYGITIAWALVALAVQNFAIGNPALAVAALGIAAVMAGLGLRSAVRL